MAAAEPATEQGSKAPPAMLRQIDAVLGQTREETPLAAATMDFVVIPVAAQGWYNYPEGTRVWPAQLSASRGDFVSFWNVWLRYWDPEGDGPRLQSFQIKIDEESLDNHSGAPLEYAAPPCFVDSDSDIVFGEAGGACTRGCCTAAFINRTRNDWVLLGHEHSYVPVPCAPYCPPSYLTGTADVGNPVPDDGTMRYLGTLALYVPAGAKGRYFISLDPAESFALDETGAFIPLAHIHHAMLDIPTGSCCYSLDLPSQGCEDMVTEAECRSRPGACNVWREGDYCPNPPSAEGCYDCLVNADCNDGSFCTVDTCDACCQCANTPIYDPETQCCVDGACGIWAKPRNTPCTTYQCGLSIGEVYPYTVEPGTPCDPGDPCKANTVCNAQGACVGNELAGANCPKPRYISFVPGGEGLATAIRVTLASLHHPDPPYNGGIPHYDFSALEGEQRWVGPLMNCPDSVSQGTMLKCAKLQCQPFYTDWAAGLGGAALHITGADIVPSSRYAVELLAPQCAGMEDTCEVVLPWRTLVTSRWGDVAAPFQDPANARSQPSAIDIAAVVDKVKDLAHACCKVRVQLRELDMDPMAPAAAIDIAADIDAVKGFAYPHPPPAQCSP